MSSRNLVKFKDVDGRCIRYKNFAGRAGTYNDEGERSFCLFLQPDEADELMNAGFNVRFRKPHPDDEDQNPMPYLPIKVNYNSSRPPQINQINSKGVIVKLDEESVSTLDWAEIVSASISIAPYNWTYGKNTGVSAYLNEMLVKIEDDSFLADYLFNNGLPVNG